MSGGGFAGFPGQSGSSASEMPPLVRRPDPAPSPEDSHPVSDPLPFQRPETTARPTASEAQGDVLTEVEAAEQLGPTGRPMPAFPEPPPVGDGPTRARVVSMCNQKGGVGKTTTTINLGAVAGGVRPQGAAGRLRPAGLAVGRPRPQPARDGPDDLQPADAARRRPSTTSWSRPACPAWTCCRPTSTCRPPRSSWSTRSPASRPCSGCSRRRSTQYDVILIDCQPSLGLLTVNALTASDGVIVPLECEYFALRGVALLKTTIDKVRERLNPRPGDRRRARHHVRRPHPAQPRGHAAPGAGLGRHWSSTP